MSDPLKDCLRGRHFTSDQQVKEMVHEWPVSQPNTFFFVAEGVQKLVASWTKSVQNRGGYVEKMMLSHRLIYYLCCCKTIHSLAD